VYVQIFMQLLICSHHAALSATFQRILYLIIADLHWKHCSVWNNDQSASRSEWLVFSLCRPLGLLADILLWQYLMIQLFLYLTWFLKLCWWIKTVILFAFTYNLNVDFQFQWLKTQKIELVNVTVYITTEWQCHFAFNVAVRAFCLTNEQI